MQTRWKEAIEAKRKVLIEIPFWDDMRKNLSTLPECISSSTIEVNIDDEIRIGCETDLESEDRTKLQKIIEGLFPWRKGPISLFDIEIDAEWKSYLKWERMFPYLPEIKGKKVLDIGCNNGYYMFRVASHEPSMVLGVDPNARYYFQFSLISHYAGLKNVVMEPVGIEELPLLDFKFDLVFYLGVIYHRRDPIESLHIVRNTLEDKGTLIIDSITVPGDSQYVLKPERYSKMRNVWSIPSEACLERWLKEAGFKNVSLISSHVTDVSEQRRTKLAPFESLSDFLDPNDPTKTIEGYPAPTRSIFRCEKY